MSLNGNAENAIELRGSITIPDTIHGKSAYEIAVYHGFDGTEEEWLNSLTDETARKAEEMIAEKKQEALASIEESEVSAVAAIEESESSALAAIESKATETIDSIPDSYEELGRVVDEAEADIERIGKIDVTWIEGQYIDSVGAAKSNASYSCTDFISLRPNGIFIPLYYDVIINPGSYVALYDADKRFIAGVTVDATVTRASGVIGLDGGAFYARITTLNYYKSEAKISVASVAGVGFGDGSVSKRHLAEDIQKTLSTEAGQAELNIAFTQGGCIGQSGKVFEHTAYSYAEHIDIKGLSGVKIVANYSGSACIAVFDEYKTMTRAILNTGNVGDLMEITFADNECYMSVSCNFWLPTPFVCYATNIATSVIKTAHLASGDNSKPLGRIVTDGGNCSIFRTIGVVGDSMASGAMAYGDATDESTTQYMDMYEYSWIQYIARACGSVGHNFSMGGLSTRTFLADVGGYRTKLEDGNHKCQAYFVALGHNDKNQGVPIGTEDDIDLDNYANNADTYYGNYAAIISRIKAVQPNAKIFVVCMKKSNPFAAYNAVVRYMATIFDNVYVLDFEQYGSDLEPSWEYTQGHGNAMGYLNYANQIASYVDWIIRNNRNDFKYVQFIGTQADQYIPTT